MDTLPLTSSPAGIQLIPARSSRLLPNHWVRQTSSPNCWSEARHRTSPLLKRPPATGRCSEVCGSPTGQDDIALSLRHAGIRFAEQSAYQKVEVVHSYGYGKILLLDGEVAFTERDEFAYHEMIAHVPALHQAAPKNILIIGGGDGGACREFLKHPTVESVTVIEIDPTVTEACREHFESMAVSLDDPRVRLLHGDGQAFLDASDTLFDIIVVDSLDSAGESRFDEMLYTSIRQALSAEGCAVVQIPSPALSPERFAANARAIRPHFVSARPYLAYLPTNSTGMLSFILAETEQGRTSRNTQDLPGLRYINDGILNSAFQLPTFVESLLED